MECDQNGTSLQVRKVAEEQGIDVDNAVNDLEERAKKVGKLLDSLVIHLITNVVQSVSRVLNVIENHCNAEHFLLTSGPWTQGKRVCL